MVAREEVVCFCSRIWNFYFKKVVILSVFRCPRSAIIQQFWIIYKIFCIDCSILWWSIINTNCCVVSVAWFNICTSGVWEKCLIFTQSCRFIIVIFVGLFHSIFQLLCPFFYQGWQCPNLGRCYVLILKLLQSAFGPLREQPLVAIASVADHGLLLLSTHYFLLSPSLLPSLFFK